MKLLIMKSSSTSCHIILLYQLLLLKRVGEVCQVTESGGSGDVLEAAVVAGFEVGVPGRHFPRECEQSCEKFQFGTSAYLLAYEAEHFLRSCQLCNHSGTPQHFKEPEGSSLCSQEPFTGPYPEPDRFSQYHHILSLYKIHFPPIYILVFLVVSFLLAFLPISYVHS
jgi:hypothetical protein